MSARCVPSASAPRRGDRSFGRGTADGRFWRVHHATDGSGRPRCGGTARKRDCVHSRGSPEHRWGPASGASGSRIRVRSARSDPPPTDPHRGSRGGVEDDSRATAARAAQDAPAVAPGSSATATSWRGGPIGGVDGPPLRPSVCEMSLVTPSRRGTAWRSDQVNTADKRRSPNQGSGRADVRRRRRHGGGLQVRLCSQRGRANIARVERRVRMNSRLWVGEARRRPNPPDVGRRATTDRRRLRTHGGSASRAVTDGGRGAPKRQRRRPGARQTLAAKPRTPTRCIGRAGVDQRRHPCASFQAGEAWWRSHALNVGARVRVPRVHRRQKGSAHQRVRNVLLDESPLRVGTS